MQTVEQQDAQLAAIAVLHDDVRRALYRFARQQDHPVTRDEAARAVRISVKLAAFHLDKLVEQGLLRADQEVPPGVRRRVGRAPKRYAPTGVELSLSVPERRYDLLGEILVDALARSDPDPGASPVEMARGIARERGMCLGSQTRQARRLGRPGLERTLAVAEEVLDGEGYEPAATLDAGLALRNCPFHALVPRAPELICSLNLAFIDGLLRGLGNDTVRAELRPEPGWCCVRLSPPPN
jgi:predicted ArsR family transcriptional regulator